MSNSFSKILHEEFNQCNVYAELENTRVETFKIILSKKPELINVRDFSGDTPLMKLCKIRPWEKKSIRFLLENGACPNIPDCDGIKPYEILKERGYQETCKLFLDFKSNRSSSSKKKIKRKKGFNKVEFI